MKNFAYSIVLLAIALSSCGPTHVVVQTQTPAPAPPPPPPPPPPQPQVSIQSFYDELSPYGSWIDYPGYGFVWSPNVSPDFKPYSSNGHWVYTDAGWTWASDYDWGWATFHYGRWFFDNAYGWMWIPGTEWAPAWVSWRQSPNYYGWAPLGPAVNGSGANVYVSAATYNPPSNYWCFVSPQYVTSPHVNNYYVSESKNVTIINNTTVINNTVTNNNITNNRVNNTTINNNTVNNTTVNNTTVNNYKNVYTAGPSPIEVERVTGTPVRPIPIQTTNKPGATQSGNGQLVMYRPKPNPAASSGNSGYQPKPAPAKVVPLNTIPTRPQRTAEVTTAPSTNNNNTVPVNNHPVNAPVNTPSVVNKPSNTVVSNPNPIPPKPSQSSPPPNNMNPPNKPPVNPPKTETVSTANNNNGNNALKNQANKAKTDSLNKQKALLKKPKPVPKPKDDNKN